MKVDKGAIFEFADAGKQAKFYVDATRCAKTGRRRQRHSSLHGVVIDSREIDGGTLAGFGTIDAVAAGLHAAHAQLFAAGEKLDFSSGCYLATDQRAGDNRAESFDRKGAINRQAEIAAGIFSRDILRLLQPRLPLSRPHNAVLHP